MQYTDHRQPGSLAESLLTQVTGSAPDGFWEGNLYSSLARVLAALPVWGFVLVCFGRGYRQTNRCAVFAFRLFIKLVAAAAFCFLFAAGLWMTLRFSGDYLPSMWSDMDFFPRLMQEKQLGFLTKCRSCSLSRTPICWKILEGLQWRLWAVSWLKVFFWRKKGKNREKRPFRLCFGKKYSGQQAERFFFLERQFPLALFCIPYKKKV